jgi:pimeloyl-ACP methyl ester carboxylesterase
MPQAPKWFAFGAAALLAAHQATAQPAPAPACPPIGTRDVAWIGNRLLQGGKGYAQTPMGEVHYRLIGPANGAVVLLLHQSPWSMIEFGEIQACLAERGVRSLAVDTPGYGLSDAPKEPPTIDGYADNLVALLDSLHIARVVVAGHHSGSTIGAALAARHPGRTLGLVMQGVPIFTPQEAAKAPGAEPQIFPLKDDGAHLSDYFKLAHDYAGPDPRTKITATWSVIERYRAGTNDVARTLVSHHDMAADLAKVQAPVLILSDAQDFLHEKDLRTARAFPRFRYLQFSEGTTHALMIDPARWAGVVADFVAGDLKPR